MHIRDLRAEIERRKGKRDQIASDLDKNREELAALIKDRRRHEQAREIIRLVAIKTQRQLQYNISDITTLALESVYVNPYSLGVEFVQRRNKTECDLYFERDGFRVNPIQEAGGGAVDVAAFALRIASWSMMRPRARNVIMLDEPFDNLSMDLIPRASEMLKQISHKLNLQFIIVTHSEGLIEAADRVFRVTIKNGISKIKED